MACFEEEKKMREREIWTREVGEKCFLSAIWSIREIGTID
jgi:hypothetical protein